MPEHIGVRASGASEPDGGSVVSVSRPSAPYAGRATGFGRVIALRGLGRGGTAQVGIDRARTYHEIGIADTDHQHNSFPGLVRRL
jgi:hypothetical protein